MTHQVLIALANTDFDPTETSVPWHTFTEAGHTVEFATGNGEPGECDPLLIDGVIFGKLGAKPENIELYETMRRTEAYQNPYRYDEIDVDRYDALVLPGGHAKGMRQYLEAEPLQEATQAFLEQDKPVGAICHGAIVLARTTDPETGQSVVAGRRMTALTKNLEFTAWALTAWKLGDYYRTYPVWVQEEVEEALGPEGTFEAGPFFASYGNPFTVVDGNLVTARWPGDATKFADDLLSVLVAPEQEQRAADEEE